MHCKYCGCSLSKLSNVCPNCGRLMDSEQLKLKKDINGYDNPYVNRLNELNKKEYRKEHKENNSIMGIAIILGVMLFIIIMAIIVFVSNR